MKILIAADGSEFSRQAALKVGEMFGSAENIEIEIVSVFEEVASTGTEPFGVSADYVREMEKSGHESATKSAAEAEEILRACFADSSVIVTTKILKGGGGQNDRRGSGKLGSGFDRHRLARLRILEPRFARFGFRRGHSSRAVFRVDCQKKLCR